MAWVWNARGIAVSARDDLAALIEERKEDKAIFGARLSKTEQTAASMDRLADAVKSGSELTHLQIFNLTEKMAEHAIFTKERFASLENNMKHDRANASMAADAAARGRRKAEAREE